MCRLFAYASPHSHAVETLLGHDEFTQFSALSELHGDGWGMAWLPESDNKAPAHVGSTRSAQRAIDDPSYGAFAASPMGRAGLIHIRWATLGFPVTAENSHPFRVGDWAFAHNGSIQDSEKIERLLSDETKALLNADTDSKRYFLLVIQRIAELGDAQAGLRQAVADIRTYCGLGSLNCILLGPDVLLALQAQGMVKPPLQLLANAIGDPSLLPAGHDENYYHLRYAVRGNALLISSTGIATDDWDELSEDSLIVADLVTNEATITPLDTLAPTATFAFGV